MRDVTALYTLAHIALGGCRDVSMNWKGWLSLMALLLGVAAGPGAAATPAVAAASDLRAALTQVAAAFRRDTGEQVRLTFGSSGNFYRQLQQGAPFELFLSADEDYVFRLADAGLTVDRGALYAIGRLAVVAPRGSPLRVDSELAGLRAALKAGQVTRFAIANPEHAPYGMRAVEALTHARLWTAIEGKLVLGENVSQALQFATTGGAQGGIVAYSLVLDPAVAQRLDHAVLPASWHRPLRQRMVLMKGAGATARRFEGYMRLPAARQVLMRYGFTLPGEAR